MKRAVRWGIAGLLVTSLVGAAPAAFASPARGSGSRDVVAVGSCSSGSAWHLTLSQSGRRIEADLEVHGAAAGQRWTLTFRDNGRTFASRTDTSEPGGSFSESASTANRRGPDHITVSARNAATGETCSASATY